MSSSASPRHAAGHQPRTVPLDESPDSLQGYYAGFVSRAVAIILDYAIIVLVTAIVAGALGIFFNIPSVQRFITWLDGVLPGSGRFFDWLLSPPFGIFFFVLFQYLYFVFFFTTTGQTVGKFVMGLRVVTVNGYRLGVRRALIRTLCYALSVAPFGLGFLWALGQDQRQAWQDRIARTYVLYVWDARYEENFLRNAVYQLTKKRAPKGEKNRK